MIVRAGVIMALILPFLALGIGVGEFLVRSTGPHFGPYQPCLTTGNNYLHHSYQFNCVSEIHVPGQGMIRFSFNEDGLRDRPRAEFEQGTLVMIGDSMVKGLGTADEKTLPRMLENAIRPKTGLPILNGGMRFSGPTLQANRLRYILRKYEVKGVIWVVNGTDVFDEPYAFSIAENLNPKGVPMTFQADPAPDFFTSVLTVLKRLSNGRIQLFEFLSTQHRVRGHYEKMKSVQVTRQVLCSAFVRMHTELSSLGIPLAFIFTPAEKERIEALWLGEPYLSGSLDEMMVCARNTNSPVIDLTRAPGFKKEFYLYDGIHFDQRGNAWAVEQSAAELGRHFERK